MLIVVNRNLIYSSWKWTLLWVQMYGFKSHCLSNTYSIVLYLLTLRRQWLRKETRGNLLHVNKKQLFKNEHLVGVLTGDPRFGGRWRACLGRAVTLRLGEVGHVDLLSIVAAGKGRSRWRGWKVVAAVGAVAVARLRAGGRTRWADVGYNAPWWRITLVRGEGRSFETEVCSAVLLN